ncbi:hypothetical protein SAMN06265360_12150 [Haloechinothrix alba]|uniref:DUF4386 domain-containing protein n=1 Tax=Haloechinothrix alba TaxID=664784 RepID=A0A238ZGU1_9PSEU|nr:hypothetical protein [Haloechinothrix alba]SNR82379.1 hypothetical protein SAMN06265360_12150 [Haloechinothrix alba]
MTRELTGTSRRALLACAWCGPLTVVVAFTGWLIAGVLPVPLGASSTAGEVVDFYSSGAHVPMGIALASIGISLVIPVIAAITYVMWLGEPGAPVLTSIQAVSGTATTVLLLVPMLLMASAGFRPERPAELTVLLNDTAWLLFITPVGPFVIQNVAIATAILSTSTTPLPRWLGFLNLWVGFTFTFDVIAYAFHDGPFAWHGLLIFWLALTSYAIWLVAMGLTIRHVIVARAAGRDPIPGVA